MKPGGSTGVSGSISLFTIIDDYLYIVENGRLLHPFNISNPGLPSVNDPVVVWGNVETLFPYNGYIFMGTPSGMIIYETSNPTVPTYVSSLSHARGCDPVVVQSCHDPSLDNPWIQTSFSKRKMSLDKSHVFPW